MAKELTAANFDETIRGNAVVMVDFWASWCGPCRMVAPFIEELAKEYEGRAAVCKVNVDDNPDIAAHLRVSLATVKRHLSSAMKKLGVSQRQALGKYML